MSKKYPIEMQTKNLNRNSTKEDIQMAIMKMCEDSLVNREMQIKSK